MKIGIISDIHSNLVALERVLERLEGCDEIICAGDVVGYYPYFNEVVEIFRKERIYSVLGNHDYSIITGDFSELDTYGKISAGYIRKNIEEKNLSWLENLPLKLETGRFNVYHGIPADSLDAIKLHVFPTFPLIEKILEVEGKSVVVGHTHIQFMKEHRNFRVVNPGSVGQPRDGDSRACYAIYDTERDSFKLDRVAYNIDEVYLEVHRAGLPHILAIRLYEGV
ncbi:phosphoesterase, MJ0936 family [Archaeoglobus sulfaticallidus PM70-1]|uniref:Phosphoesterase n=1 Tax=Archaeoglobus sulfaticallidus PM70-1 TaxID=387631 RepID=N0BMY0_9EURY|nr:metallophosphoesterase family protein [Archaeoglobus sulfaticallidus]AGK61966.1 phosphoesterase, MJ0936 family [Archaeoglobus sulfaticallidus PM70-1]